MRCLKWIKIIEAGLHPTALQVFLIQMQVIDYSNSEKFEQDLADFCALGKVPSDLSAKVSEILSGVKNGGDLAALRYTQAFDGAQLQVEELVVSPAELAQAPDSLSDTERLAIMEAIEMVQAFHRHTLPKNWKTENKHGAQVGERFYPIERVGLYIPGGNVPLVSTVVMTAVLAKLVGCPEIIVCTPPQADSSIAPAMLAALNLVGVDQVYRLGGVQAIAAMAYGTETVPAVDKIFGPGNACVMEAKRQVLGAVGIDLLPGPSEVMVIADAGAHPQHIAADLLAQAEHGSWKELVYFVTTSQALVSEVKSAVVQQLPLCRHAGKCKKIIDERCLVVVCPDLKVAAQVANRVAPEHLELQVAEVDLEALSTTITTAGAMLLGYMTPTVVGDFVAGPSHTLPTGQAGRFFSGLQATDFMRRTSVLKYDAESLRSAAATVNVFASLEQLDAHGRSLQIRL